jgi:hypothetical protein
MGWICSAHFISQWAGIAPPISQFAAEAAATGATGAAVAAAAAARAAGWQPWRATATGPETLQLLAQELSRDARPYLPLRPVAWPR